MLLGWLLVGVCVVWIALHCWTFWPRNKQPNYAAYGHSPPRACLKGRHLFEFERPVRRGSLYRCTACGWSLAKQGDDWGGEHSTWLYEGPHLATRALRLVK
jgi:hypothetical protein